jgi:hypothetical protein
LAIHSAGADMAKEFPDENPSFALVTGMLTTIEDSTIAAKG